MLTDHITKVFAICVADQFGQSIYTKFYLGMFTEKQYTFQGLLLEKMENQQKFIQSVVEKAKVLTQNNKTNDLEVFSHFNFNIVLKKSNDIFLFVIGDSNENEILLSNIMDTLYQSLDRFCEQKINKQNIIEKYEKLILILDEIIYEGMIVNLDVQQIINRCQMQTENQYVPPSTNITTTSSLFSSVFASAKSQLSKTLNIK